MRIAIDARDAFRCPLRGVGKTLVHLIRALEQVGVPHELVLYFQPDGQPEEKIAGCTAARKRPVSVRGDRFGLWDHVALPGALLKDRADLLHCTSPVSSFWLPVRTVVTVHDVIPLRIDDGWPAREVRSFRRSLERNVRRAARVIAVSEYTKKDLTEVVPEAAGKTVVIPWAAGPEYRPRCESEIRRVVEKASLADPYFVAFGGRAPRKNVFRLLKAFQKHKKEGGASTLMLLGVSGKFARELEAELVRLGLGAEDVKAGFLDEADVPAVLSGALAVFYVSLYEGFGLPILEAMSCGTPVVTSDRTSLPEVAGDAAYYVNPESTAEIAEAFRVLEVDQRLRTELSTKGLERAALFSWGRTARLTLEAYEEALG